MGQFEALLQPFQLKHLQLRNRIMSTAHAPAYGRDGMPAERYQAIQANPAGRFQLFRVGDAVASRNIHAATDDSLRLCKEL